MEASFKHLGTVLYLHVMMQVFIGLLYMFLILFIQTKKRSDIKKGHISACEVPKLALSH